MPKILAITLVILFLALGVLIGNQYGRRDVVNSRPPNIEGQLGQPGVVGLPNSGYFLSHLSLRAVDGNVSGGISVLSKQDGQSEVEAEIFGLADGNYRLAIYNNDNTPIRELTSFATAGGNVIKLNAIFATPVGEYYFGVIPRDSGDIILKSQ